MPFETWPLGQIPDHLRRPELDEIRQHGYHWDDPYDVVGIFEQKVAEFAGAKHGVAVDCCSHGIFLSLKYLNAIGTITIPCHTYASVPMQILHAGCQVKFEDIRWSGKYRLDPYPVWDAATMWRSNMYESGLHVVSFQIKKPIPIGRGGMILTDDAYAYHWLKKACHDGRDMHKIYAQDDFEMIGWHYYMTPEDAARGILLMDRRSCDYQDRWSDLSYYDLSLKSIFK